MYPHNQSTNGAQRDQSHGVDVPWYTKDLPNVTYPVFEILKTYSGIAEEEIIPHVRKIRNEAWATFPYPCFGQWNFLEAGIVNQRRYPEIVSRLKDGQKLADLGCGIAQDVRQLIFDGAPAENVFGVELEEGFNELGYALFLDEQRLQSKLLVADLFDDNSEIKQLEKRMDIVYTSQFFHLFGWETQVEAGKRVVRLLNPKSKSLIIGYQAARVEAEEVHNTPTKEGKMFFHNPTSFQKLWDEIGDATDTAWNVDAVIDSPKNFQWQGFPDHSILIMSFSIERSSR